MSEKKYACPFLYDKGVTSPVSLSTLYSIHGITDHQTDTHTTWYSLSSTEWLSPISYSNDSLYDSFTCKYFIRDKFSTQEKSSSWLTIDELTSGAWYTFSDITVRDVPVSPSNTPVTMYSIATRDLVDAVQYTENDHTIKYLIKDTYNTTDFRWLREDELEGAGYSLTRPSPSVMPLNFTALDGGGTIALTRVGASTSFTCSYKYSIDSVNWNDYTIGTALTLNEGDKVYFNGSRSAQYPDNHLKFVMTGSISASGSVNSLLNENFEQITDLTEFGGFTFYNLFSECTSLTSPPELPATILESVCYSGMFYGCTSLKVAPRLPATTLKDSCYDNMFYGCTSLEQPPELPATQLATGCYSSMFNGCTSLEQAPELLAAELAPYCYTNMFYGCTSLEVAPELPATTLAGECYRTMFYGCTDLMQAPELPATELVEGCYRAMFYGCTGLTSAPELPATTLAEYCYYAMFYECAGLTSAPELPATTLAEYCYAYMFYGCTGLTSTSELPATTLAEYCYMDMFYGCTGLTSAPELPATELAEGCYRAMFYGCTSLKKVKCYATNIYATDATKSWLYNVSSTGTFYRATGVSWPRTTSGAPSGWTLTNL